MTRTTTTLSPRPASRRPRSLPANSRSTRTLVALLAASALAASTLRAAPSAPVIGIDEDRETGGSYSKSATPARWLTDATADWMAALPDDLPLSRVSIPGTHDSGARFGGAGAEAQSWSIDDQLAAGIRYFDIRCRPTGESFAIHHGAFFQHQMFGTVLNSMTRFLRAHPGEVIAMRWKTGEHTAQPGSDSERTIADRYMAKHSRYFYEGDGDVPTLGEARGKIVILRDGKSDPGYGLSFWGSHTTVQDFYKVYWFAHRKTKGTEWATLPSKKDQVKAHIDLASSSSSWVLNHLSGAYGMIPSDVARATNATAYSHIGSRDGKRCVGTVIMDFPGEQLVYRIIESNFAAPRTAKVPYQIAVTTGDVRHAGTNATVYVRIRGSKGWTRSIPLSKGFVGGGFERGTTDVGVVSELDVGRIQSVEISHDNTGSAAGWYAAQVTVIKLAGEGGIQTKKAEINAWLTGDRAENTRVVTAR